jgi:hypothetical protein
VEVGDAYVFESVFDCGPGDVVPVWEGEWRKGEVEEDAGAGGGVVRACGRGVIVPPIVVFGKWDVCEGEVEDGGAFCVIVGEEGVDSGGVEKGEPSVVCDIKNWVREAEFFMGEVPQRVG